jgi:DNA-directed RNA polymerase specialized sigma24 family protein
MVKDEHMGEEHPVVSNAGNVHKWIVTYLSFACRVCGEPLQDADLHDLAHSGYVRLLQAVRDGQPVVPRHVKQLHACCKKVAYRLFLNWRQSAAIVRGSKYSEASLAGLVRPKHASAVDIEGLLTDFKANAPRQQVKVIELMLDRLTQEQIADRLAIRVARVRKLRNEAVEWMIHRLADTPW